MPQGPQIRRIVTGHDDNGKAIVEMDAIATRTRVRADSGIASALLWVTDETPARGDLRKDRADREIGVPPPASGSILRVVDFPPVTNEMMKNLDQAAILAQMGAGHNAGGGANAGNPFMHRTRSVDYAIVMEGEIDMLLDDSEVHLKTGDIVVQQATNHAWVNRSDRPCRIAFVLIDGTDPLENASSR
jgi:mannose-6-phosphate isomerase-like protein (cupin superfamily)